MWSCSSYQYSNKSEREQTQLQLVNYKNPLHLEDIVEANNPDISTRGLISTDLLVQGANLAIDGVKMLIDESQKKYHAEYISGLSNVKFYDQNSEVGMLDPEGISFKGFSFHRSFKEKKGDQTGAVFASFSIDESKLEDIYFNSKFYLKLDSLDIDYAKVKVNDNKWYLPWTWFLRKEKTFHLDFEIDIAVNWIDELGTIHNNVPFGKFVLAIRDIPLDPASAERSQYFDQYKGMSLSGASYMIPRSTTYCTDARGRVKTCYGRGDFSVTVKVKESSKTDFVSQMIMDNSDDIFNKVKADDLIKALNKK
jgi:hypothetical protein